MKRRKITIFSLILLMMIIGGGIFFRFTFVTKGQKLENVVYKSENLIIHIAKQGGNEKLVILGSGYSLSIDEQDRIISHDPLMILPSVKDYQEDTTVMSIFYPFESEGLEAAGRELSNFIDSKLEDYSEITLIGHSKCGVCFANATKWIEREVNIITISAPFEGTPVANEKIISENLNWVEKKAFGLIFSNHAVDQDISPNSEFLINADYSGLKKHNYINIISICPQKVDNPIDFVLMYMDKKGVFGDGIVPKKSQESPVEGGSQEEIEATHATSLEKGIQIVKEKYIPNL